MEGIGALFDWDGVVIDSSDQHERSWEQLAEEEGRPLPADHFKRGFGMKNEKIIPGILGWTDDAGEVRRMSLRKEALYRDIIREEGITPLPGVAELLALLADEGVPCAVASSTHRENIETIFDAIGLRHRFQAVVTAEDVSHGKPDPEVFVESARRIGRPPERCVVFEDAHVGIEAGLAAGARVVAVATTHPADSLGRAHVTVERLTGVDRNLLASLFA